MKVSVALAARDGERFLAEQVESILTQLAPTCDPPPRSCIAHQPGVLANGGKPQLLESEPAGGEPLGELVLSVDPSGDDTLALAQSLAKRQRGVFSIRVLIGPDQGAAANFAHALQACGGDIIFLADQDDVWLPAKLQEVLAVFNTSSALLVLHDAIVVDEELEILHPSYFTRHRSRAGLLVNIWRNSFVGSCLAFRRELLDLALPFPADVPMHDWWLGLVAQRCGEVILLPRQLILYRRHLASVTGQGRGSIASMLRWRLVLIGALRRRLLALPRSL